PGSRMPSPVGEPGQFGRSSLFYKLYLCNDLHIFTYQYATRFEGRVPVKIEVGSADLSCYCKTCLLVTPGIFADTTKFHIKLYRFRHIPYRKVAVKYIILIAFLFDPGRFEFQLRKLFRREEIVRPEVVVAICVMRGD